MVRNIDEDIAKIRKRPSMFIGKNSIIAMAGFLSGYLYALQTTGCSLMAGQLPYALFDTFAAKIYQQPECMGWSLILQAASGDDEEKALGLFFSLFDRFCALRISSCKRVVLTEGDKRYHRTADDAPRQLIRPSDHWEKVPFDRWEKVPRYIDAEQIYCACLTDGSDGQKRPWSLFAVEYADAVCCERMTLSEDEIMQYAQKCFGRVRWDDVRRDLLESGIGAFTGKPVYHKCALKDRDGYREYRC